MYDVADIITLLASTGYEIERAKAKEPTLSELTNLPIVYVGFRSLDSNNPTTPNSHSDFEQAGENLVQAFDLQICCEEENLPVIWRTIYKTLQGTNSQPLEQQFSSMTYQKGGVMGIENGRLWWLDRWAVQFPSFNTFDF